MDEILKEIQKQNELIEKSLKGQIDAGIEDLKKNFEEFKTANDERLKKVEVTGAEPSDYTEKLAKMEEDLQTKEDKITKLTVAFQRAGVNATPNPIKGRELEQTPEAIKYKDQFFNKFIRKGKDIDEDVRDAYVKQLREKTGGLVSDDSQGGFLAPPEVERKIREVLYDTSPVRQVCGVKMISANAWETVLDDPADITGRWSGEDDPSGTTPSKKVNVKRIQVHDFDTEVITTQNIIQDALFDIEGWYNSKTANKIMRSEATAVVKGEGNGRPRGLLTYGETGENDHSGIQVSESGAVKLTFDDFVNCFALLKTDYQPNAKWVMSRFTLAEIRKLKDTQNRYLIDIADGISKGNPMSVLGFPIVVFEDLARPAANGNFASGDKPIIFGDFKEGYHIVDRVGSLLIRDPLTKKGSIILYTKKRCGGGLVEGDRLKLIKIV